MKTLGDRLNIRLGDIDKPTRGRDFEEALGLADKTKVTKALIDALIAYHEKHGSLPNPPFVLSGTGHAKK